MRGFTMFLIVLACLFWGFFFGVLVCASKHKPQPIKKVNYYIPIYKIM